MKDQRAAALITSSMSAVSLLGLMLAPSLALLWAVLLGFGCGASLILGLTFIGLRTTNARDAAALSGMAQCIGYLIALLGAWTGLLAGRNLQLQPAAAAN